MVSIIDIDSKIPNLALKKVEKYFLDKGESVEWNNPLMAAVSDITFVSCVFTVNRAVCLQWEGIAEIGGTGYDIHKTLPLDIDAVKPRINYGFTTRGCIRKCPFCFVPEKEGKIRIEGDIYDIWDGKARELIIMDNNILALPDHFKMICAQLRKERVKVDFNQGLDIRLLNDGIAHELSTLKYVSDLRFAWDNIKDEQVIVKGIELLKKHGCHRAMFYVLVGFDTTLREDLYRLETLKKLDQRAYCMRHENVAGQKEYQDLSSWVNQTRFFISMTYERYKECRRNRKLLRESTVSSNL